MTPRRLATRTAITAAALLLVTGCTSPAPTPKDTTLQVKTQAEAEKLVQQLADSVAAAVGSPLTDQHSTPAPCADGGGGAVPWTLSGVANVAVKPADQVATLMRLHDTWKSQGYEITEFQLVPAGTPDEGSVSARVPVTELTVTVQSTGPRTGFAIIIATPCYAPAPGENPGN